MIDLVARRLFKEQIRKELIDELRGYQVGLMRNGSIIATKTSKISDGYLFIIPGDKYQELFGRE